MLGPNAFRHLGDSLKVLLEGQDETVLEVYKTLPSILMNFQTADNPKLQAYLDGLLVAITEYRKTFDEKPTSNWRIHEAILKSMEFFPTIFDNDLVNENFVPCLQRVLVDVNRMFIIGISWPC